MPEKHMEKEQCDNGKHESLHMYIIEMEIVMVMVMVRKRYHKNNINTVVYVRSRGTR